MLSCVHCKCANQLSLALGCASSVTEIWIFSVASGSPGCDSHPEMPKHAECLYHIQSDVCLWPNAP